MAQVILRSRNRYPGRCCHCSKRVKPGDGFPEKRAGVWHVIHEKCETERTRKRDEEQERQRQAEQEYLGEPK